MKSDTLLNALIRNLSKEKNVNAQILLQNFMLEKILEKISLSTYRENFILKGGMLIANMIGVDLRSTMDMDATISGFKVSEDTIREMFLQILSVQTSGEIEMELEKVERILE